METNEEKGRRQSDAKTLFLKSIINFAKFITTEQGKLLKRTAGFGYINTIRELYNFEDFSFYMDLCQTTMGGNELKIWYHPSKQYEKELVPVLDVWWQLEVSNNTKAKRFESNRKWQNEFLRAIKRQKDKEFIAKQAAEYAKKRVRTQYEEEMRKKHLAKKEKHQPVP
jgi:hypothetical protein